MRASFAKARGRPSRHIVYPSEPFTRFKGTSGVRLRTRAFSTALVLTSLCFGALGTATAYSDEEARSLSDYRKAAEERTKNPSHKASPSDIGPDYGDAGNKPRAFDIGVALYDANDFAGAYAIWLPLAQRDDLAAQRNVAHLLRHGKGTPQNLPRALYFYERASEGGLVPASVNAGVMHLRGEGTGVDPETALRFLAVGVKSKHPVALYEVALMLAQGNGITKNPKKARDYLALSARAGYAPARQKLDAVKAAELISAQPKPLPTPPRLKPVDKSKTKNQSKSQKIDKSRQSLALPKPVSGPKPVSETMPTTRHPLETPVPQAPGQKPAARAELSSGIQLVLPEQGRRFVQGNQHYEAGRYLKAAGIWQRLAEEGVVEAQFRLGELYFQGQGLPKNNGNAVRWLTLAADRGHRGAATLLTRATSTNR